MLNFVDKPIRVLIVFNPGAGQAGSAEQDVHAARDVWREHGWQVDLRPTAGPGDGTRIAREAATQGYHLVVAAGGDGTVNEVINGLAGTQTALAALPIGTVNVWVRELGLPLQPRAAAEALLHAQIRTIDLGRAGDRYFLLMCGSASTRLSQLKCAPTRSGASARWPTYCARPTWPAAFAARRRGSRWMAGRCAGGY